MTTTMVGARRGMKWQAVQAVGGAVLALAVAAGIGTWQLHGRDTTAGAPTTSEARTGAATADAAPASVTPHRMAAAEMTYYLVGSPGQADAVHAQLAEDSSFLAEVGAPPRESPVLVVLSAEDEARVGEMISNDYYMRQAAGLPLPRVVDLRTP